jgi:mannose-1-phosphate guanylyltransferase
MLHVIVMAGGAGTRFWPASRKASPKQLLKLLGDRSMLQSTVDRIGSLCPRENVLVVTNATLVDAVRTQLPELPWDSIIGEPAKRDTAPCVALAAAMVLKKDPDATMLVMPADHVIEPLEKFVAAIREAASLVQRQPESIVTFGILPSYPAVVFGYIERGAALSGVSSAPAFDVVRFREKPDLKTAREFVDSGNFYWNAGIFVWKAWTIDRAIQKFEPEIHAHVLSITSAIGTTRFQSTFETEFIKIKSKSIDFAVMERYQPVVVVEAPFHWDDVGNWSAVPRLSGVDHDGNSISGRHVGIKTSGSIVRTTADHLVVTLGVDDLIIVHTPDATLVANRNDEAAVKQVVETLEKMGWEGYV